jgi:hypothetical protein
VRGGFQLAQAAYRRPVDDPVGYLKRVPADTGAVLSYQNRRCCRLAQYPVRQAHIYLPDPGPARSGARFGAPAETDPDPDGGSAV